MKNKQSLDDLKKHLEGFCKDHAFTLEIVKSNFTKSFIEHIEEEAERWNQLARDQIADSIIREKMSDIEL